MLKPVYLKLIATWDVSPVRDPLYEPVNKAGFVTCRSPIEFWHLRISDIRGAEVDLEDGGKMTLRDAFLDDRPPWQFSDIRLSFHQCEMKLAETKQTTLGRIASWLKFW